MVWGVGYHRSRRSLNERDMRKPRYSAGLRENRKTPPAKAANHLAGPFKIGNWPGQFLRLVNIERGDASSHRHRKQRNSCAHSRERNFAAAGKESLFALFDFRFIPRPLRAGTRV